MTTLQAADGEHQYWSTAPSKWCSCSLRRLSSANRQVATLSKFQQLSRAKTQAGPLLYSSRWYIVSPPALPTRCIIVKYLEYRQWCQRLPVTNQQLFDLTVLPGPQQVQARGLLHRCQCHPFRSCRRVSRDMRSLDARGWRMVSMSSANLAILKRLQHATSDSFNMLPLQCYCKPLNVSRCQVLMASMCLA